MSTRCEACDAAKDINRFRVTGPPGVAFERSLCPWCVLKGKITGWVVTPIEVATQGGSE